MSSLKMTFSLASLVLIFALVFAAMPAMAATGGPTVEIDHGQDKAKQTRGVFKIKLTFTEPVEAAPGNTDLMLQYYDKDNLGLGTAAQPTYVRADLNATPPIPAAGDPALSTTDAKIVNVAIDVSNIQAGAVGFQIVVGEDASTSKLVGGKGNATNSKNFALPPVHIGKVVIEATKVATDTDPTDGQDYDLTFTFKDTHATVGVAPGTPLDLSLHVKVTPDYVDAPVTTTDPTGEASGKDWVYKAMITRIPWEHLI